MVFPLYRNVSSISCLWKCFSAKSNLPQSSEFQMILKGQHRQFSSFCLLDVSNNSFSAGPFGLYFFNSEPSTGHWLSRLFRCSENVFPCKIGLEKHFAKQSFSKTSSSFAIITFCVYKGFSQKHSESVRLIPPPNPKPLGMSLLTDSI